MNISIIIDMIGYLGSALVVVSMLMTSVIKLRVINTIGSCIFAAYACIIHSYPTAIMNFCLVAINVYNLIHILKKDQHYDLIDGNADETFVTYILNHYKEDIKIFFPDFHMNPVDIDIAYIVCADAIPAGVFLGRRTDRNTVEIILDYSTPAYRDCSVGTYLYSKLPMKGIHRLIYAGRGEKHKSYLLKVGFVLENGIYVKNL